MDKYVLSIDQGTTGTTAMLLDEQIQIVGKINEEFAQIYPKPGWVEHDPEAIWSSVTSSVAKVLKATRVDPRNIAGIGITNQRETVVLWERKTGKALHNAIVWQDRRTATLCEQLKHDGKESLFKGRTGLVLDPYFSGTKVRWLLDNINGLRARAEAGEIAFGTIDTYLIWRLTGGKSHVTDVSNASRTLLFNLQKLAWDPELLNELKIPEKILPKVVASSEVYGVTKGVPGLPDGIPVAGAAGDQQAALFGQACFNKGDAKCTYGTGAFLLVNTGATPVVAKSGVLSTVAWKINGTTSYALEGSAFIAGAAVQWLRDGLNLIKKAADIEELAREVPDSGGVIFVPALVGLGAPHWRPNARGTIVGLTRGTTKAHLARATLEGIALQIRDLTEAICKDIGQEIANFKVDGGAAANDLLMQIQADLLQTEIVRPKVIETTALGAAFLAGLAVGIWNDPAAIQKAWRPDKRFTPTPKSAEQEDLLQRWAKAVAIA
ncbi:MAG: glycerol kinase GlpK [Pseudomonadota bacterium]